MDVADPVGRAMAGVMKRLNLVPCLTARAPVRCAAGNPQAGHGALAGTPGRRALPILPARSRPH